MPQRKVIQVDTTYTADNLGNMNIVMKRAIEFENTIGTNLNLTPNNKKINNKRIESGNLAVVLKNHLADIDLFTDEKGHLIVSGEDAQNYSLDETGHLIYNYR